MDHYVLNSSDLYKLLQDTLLNTEKVKEILRRNCDEATFVLKPWQTKMFVEKQAESICNCNKIANENEAQKIATEISNTIILAQELREKLKLNVATKRKSIKKDTVKTIYLSNSMKDRKKLSKTNIATQNTSTTKISDCNKASTTQIDKAEAVAKSSSKPKLTSDTKRSTKDITGKMQSNKLLKKVTVKTKKGKNFILENKLSIKRISSANKLQADDSNSHDTSRDARRTLDSPRISAVRLSDLIHKTHQSINSAFLPSTDNAKNNCPIHGHNSARQRRENSVEEQVVMVDIVEALQDFTVPNEIIKVLKIYYTFLKNEENSDIKKKNTSIDTFLTAFKATITNASTQNCSLRESLLLKATADSIFAFSSIFEEDLDTMQLNDIKNIFTDLGSILKSYNVEDVARPITRKLFCNISLTKGWISNGIWNVFCVEQLKSFSKLYNVRYSNKKQLVLLYETIQKLQRMEYLNTLIRIILRDIIPMVKSNTDPTSAEYVQAYKTIYILYQGLNPKIPVLVKTDN